MNELEYGPLRFLIGKWQRKGFMGFNRAPDADREVENTKFRQEIVFEPAGFVENHEQLLYFLDYKNKTWEEGDEEGPFHQEVGYFIWDKSNGKVLKSFAIPRGVSVNAGGNADVNATDFIVKAELGSSIYGFCSNEFLDKEFQTISYEVRFQLLSNGDIEYNENTRIKIKNQDRIFDHTESNILSRV